MENNELKLEMQKLIDAQDQKFSERFNKMGSAFLDLKNTMANPERKYEIRPHASMETNELDKAHALCLTKLRCVPREAAGNRGRYAKVEHIAAYANPFLGEVGLSVKQLLTYNEYGEDVLVTRLSHASGQWIESRIMLKLEKNQSQSPNQQFGSSITYMRRYAFLAILGIGATDDPTDNIE